MFLGIEIGGTKLQLGVGPGDSAALAALERADVQRAEGAEGIRRQIQALAGPLIQRHGVRALGIGFGGPVDPRAGQTIKSHQIEGWDDFPLVDWCRQAFGLPAALSNDSDAAGLAEARFGAGRGSRIVFYTNVGSGIGGALAINGQVHCGGTGVASEIGHLRPGLLADQPDQTVESLASGWAIAEAAQARLAEPFSHALSPLLSGSKPLRPESVRQKLIECEEADEQFAADLLDRCQGQPEQLTTRMVAEAALRGNRLALDIFRHACQVFGWAVAQMITLLAPEVVVVGGGVSLVGEELFFIPLRREVDRYVFPPLRRSFRIVPAELGESVVLYGALAVAADQVRDG